ncbi:MAG: efflux RND transporter periplasmic adaptor subunit [Myxococcota bacterium]
MTESPTPPPLRRRLLPRATAALAVGVALTAAAFGLRPAESRADVSPAAPPPSPVTVAHPEARTLVEYDDYLGRFVASERVEVRARVSGYLASKHFTDGQIVEKGDLLFRIDPRPLAADLSAARAGLRRAEAALEDARRQAKRGVRLLEQSALSVEETDRRRRGAKVAGALRAEARARVRRAQLELSFTEVRAPITGRVGDAPIDPGNLVEGGSDTASLLTTIVAVDPIELEFAVSESDYLRYVRRGQQGAAAGLGEEDNAVTVRLVDEERFAWTGALSFVDNVVDPRSGTMRARATFANPDGLLVPGLFGRVRLPGTAPHDVILVDDAAVQSDQGDKFVWVVDERDEVARRGVTLGPLADGQRIVRDGLAPSDRVVVDGLMRLRAGATVAPTLRPPSSSVPADGGEAQ